MVTWKHHSTVYSYSSSVVVLYIRSCWYHNGTNIIDQIFCSWSSLIFIFFRILSIQDIPMLWQTVYRVIYHILYHHEQDKHYTFTFTSQSISTLHHISKWFVIQQNTSDVYFYYNCMCKRALPCATFPAHYPWYYWWYLRENISSLMRLCSWCWAISLFSSNYHIII